MRDAGVRPSQRVDRAGTWLRGVAPLEIAPQEFARPEVALPSTAVAPAESTMIVSMIPP